MTENKNFLSGFAAVIGRPNAGKSTLINSLVGQKVVIMSNKPQTTRNNILCVLSKEDFQIVFIDTPGIHKPHHKLGEFMVKAAETALTEVDVILLVVDVTETPAIKEDPVLKRLESVTTPVILVVNKIDRMPKQRLLPILESYRHAYSFAAIVPVSAVEKVNLDGVVTEICRFLPQGPQYFPADMVTDQPERLIIAEMIREKVLHLTREEVPHSVAVESEEITTRANGDLYVRAVIYVEKESQKGIIIGAKGKMLKDVGKAAREDIEKLLETRVFLDLWVKVKKDWRNRQQVLHQLGYD